MSANLAVQHGDNVLRRYKVAKVSFGMGDEAEYESQQMADFTFELGIVNFHRELTQYFH
ncbi:MAG: hypothetical protein ACTHLA_06425 [Asticcacaulis sp.]|uniref:hypothetical protein n=1 Tax=Asticcacaulis sp. TaxID=1872648 RepID=UPI003F7C21B0